MIRHAMLILALCLATSGARAEIGRLFFTPEKRASLDHARKYRLTDRQVDKPASITINGVIQGPQGATLWVNGTPVENQSITAGMKVHAGEELGSAHISPITKTTAPQRAIKVGETLRTRPGQ